MKKPVKKLYLQSRKRYFKNILGTSKKPRLSVFRSNNHIYAQLIDDSIGKTLLESSSLKKSIKEKKVQEQLSPKQIAFLTGQQLGQIASEKGITKVVFDRGEKPYHGRIQNLAEGVRTFGLQF